MIFSYHSRVRKQLRSVRRILGYQFTRELYPRCSAPRAWWWSQDPNFGDLLTPFILPYYGIAPLLKPISSVDLVAVGSVLKSVPSDYEGVVWGSGSFGDEKSVPADARYVAVRGKLTWERIGKPEILAFGDPGLLMRRIVPPVAGTRKIGIVAHLTHRDSPIIKQLLSLEGVQDVDVRWSPRRVARAISSCEAIITTSLHGLIVADSYGIPAAWSMLEPVVSGADFKFWDHESVVGAPRSRRVYLTGGETRTALIASAVAANPEEVSERIHELEASTDLLRRSFGKMVQPWEIWGLQRRI